MSLTSLTLNVTFCTTVWAYISKEFMPRRFHEVGLDLPEIFTILYLSLTHNPVVDAQALFPDPVEKLYNMSNVDHLDEHEKRRAKVTRNAGDWLNYALNQAFNPNC